MLGWARRHAFPLIASVGLLAVGMFTTTWGPTLIGQRKWALPYDLWGTLIATSRLAHGHPGGLYTQPTGLISLPGAAVILIPCALLISALGISLMIPGNANPHPPLWLVAGPYTIAICCVTLFAAEALAVSMGVPRWKRGLLAVASASALWSVSARWGHPEDAVAVGLLLYGVLAQSRGRVALAGWLTGCAICVQPLVLLAVPVMLAVLPLRRMPWFLLRAALPSVILLGAAAAANWSATYTAVTSQPDSPTVNHPTAWTPLAAHMTNTNVAAGPFRLATIILACCFAALLYRHWRGRVTGPDGAWPAPLAAEVLWWIALALALRSFFEPVMVSYYPWPPIAVALIPAATLSYWRLIATGVVGGGLTAAAQGPSHSPWIWWAPLVAGLVVLLVLAWPDGGLAVGRWLPRGSRIAVPDLSAYLRPAVNRCRWTARDPRLARPAAQRLPAVWNS